MSFEEILRIHAEKYPKMQPTDAVKLAYQSEFGGGHLIKDSKMSLYWIEKELSSISESCDTELYELIGGGLCRVNLAALKKNNLTPEKLNEVFVSSANEVKGSIAEFERKLESVVELTKTGVFHFAPQSLYEYLREYRKAGYPPVSHSEEYRTAYHPAYRVVLLKYLETD